MPKVNPNVIQGAAFAAIQAFLACLKDIAENSIRDGIQWDLGWRPPTLYDIKVLQYNLVGDEHQHGSTTIRQYLINTNLMTAKIWVARSNSRMPWLPVLAEHEGLGPNPPFWHTYEDTAVALCPKCHNTKPASGFHFEFTFDMLVCSCGEEMEVWPASIRQEQPTTT